MKRYNEILRKSQLVIELTKEVKEEIDDYVDTLYENGWKFKSLISNKDTKNLIISFERNN